MPQTPTPPRPQTQSPVVQPIVPMYSSLILPSNMVPVGPPQTAQTQGNRYPKRGMFQTELEHAICISAWDNWFRSEKLMAYVLQSSSALLDDILGDLG